MDTESENSTAKEEPSLNAQKCPKKQDFEAMQSDQPNNQPQIVPNAQKYPEMQEICSSNNNLQIQQKTKLRQKYGSCGEVSFSEEEWNKLLKVVDNLEDELMLKFAVSTGLRREDLANVFIENINFEQGTLIYYERKKHKNRVIPLQENVLKLIKIYLNNIPKKQRRLFDFTGRTAYNHLASLCDKAGIPRRPFHALRSTCAKFCLKAGWTELEVAKLLGDKIETIQTHYIVPSNSDMSEVVKKKSFV